MWVVSLWACELYEHHPLFSMEATHIIVPLGKHLRQAFNSALIKIRFKAHCWISLNIHAMCDISPLDTWGQTSYLKIQPIHSRALLAAILSLLSCSVDIMSSCSLLVLPLSVHLTSSHLCCFCFSVSWTGNCARLYHISQYLKSTKAKSHGNNVRDIIVVHMMSADTHTQTNRHGKCKAILGPAGHPLHTWPAGKNTSTEQHSWSNWVNKCF